MHAPPWDPTRVEEVNDAARKRRPRSAPSSRRRGQGSSNSTGDLDRRKGTKVPGVDSSRQQLWPSGSSPRLTSKISSSPASGRSRSTRMQWEQEQQQRRRVKFREGGPFGTGTATTAARSSRTRSRSTSNTTISITSATGQTAAAAAAAAFPGTVAESTIVNVIRGSPIKGSRGAESLRKELHAGVSDTTSPLKVTAQSNPKSPVLIVRHRPFCIDQTSNSVPLELEVPRYSPKVPVPVKRNIDGLSPQQVQQREQQRPGSPITHAFSTLTKTTRYTGFGDQEKVAGGGGGGGVVGGGTRQRPKSAAPSTRAPSVFPPAKARAAALSPDELKAAIVAADRRTRAALPTSLRGKLIEHRLSARRQALLDAENASMSSSTEASTSVAAESMQFDWEHLRRGSVAGDGATKASSQHHLLSPQRSPAHAHVRSPQPSPAHVSRASSIRRHSSLRQHDDAHTTAEAFSPSSKDALHSFDPERLMRTLEGCHGYNAYSSNNRPVVLWSSTAGSRNGEYESAQRVGGNVPAATRKSPILKQKVQRMDNVAETPSSPDGNTSPAARTVENEFTELVPSTKASKHFSPLRQPTWYSRVTGMPVSRCEITDSAQASLVGTNEDMRSLATNEDVNDDAAEPGDVAAESLNVDAVRNHADELERSAEEEQKAAMAKSIARPSADEPNENLAAAAAASKEEVVNEENAEDEPVVEVVHGGDYFGSLANTMAIAKQQSVQIEEYLMDVEVEHKAVLEKQKKHHRGEQHTLGDHMGVAGRLAFFDKCRASHNLRLALGDHDDDASVHWVEDEGRTPRSRYLRHVVGRSGELPLPVLNRTWEDPHTINLEGRGIGDAVMLSLVAVLNELPSLTELNVADNMLTDASLVPLMAALVDQDEHGVKSLNISSNDMDEACHDLEKYLAEDDCSLKKLQMSNSDIDDIECAVFMKALGRNHTVTFLNLSHNEIGKMETRNHVEPSFITGGEAIATMLTQNRTLHHLDLSWNYIMKGSAEELGNAVSSNFTLTSLCLSHNTFHDLGSQRLAESMRFNRVIKNLDLSYNDVSPRAALVMAEVLKHNEVLNYFVLEGNPLGRLGSEALMVGLSQATNGDVDIQLSIANCETRADYPNLFDALEPTGTYYLDLSLPYDSMVAQTLLRLTNTKVGNEIVGLQHREAGQESYKVITLYRGSPPVKLTDDWQRLCIGLLEYLFVTVQDFSSASHAESPPVIMRQIPLPGGVEDYGSVCRGDTVVLCDGISELRGLHAHEAAVVEVAKIFNGKLRLKLKRDRIYNPHIENVRKSSTDGGDGDQEGGDSSSSSSSSNKISRQIKVSKYEILGWFDAFEVTKPTLVDPEIRTRVQAILKSLKMSPSGALLDDIAIDMELRRQIPYFGLLSEEDEWDDFEGGAGAEAAPAHVLLDTRTSEEVRADKKLEAVEQAGLDHIRLWRGKLVKRVRPGRYDLIPKLTQSDLAPDDIMKAIFHIVFKRVDVDKSNQVDSRELYQGMQALGASVNQQDVERTMSVYDIDGGGSFEIDEFTSCLMHEYLQKEPAPKGLVYDNFTHLPWRLPPDGELIVNFEAEPTPPKSDEGISQDKGVEELVRNILGAKNDMERQELMEKAITSEGMILSAKHAQFMIDRCARGLDIMGVVASILPQVPSFSGRNEIFTTNLNHYERFRARVKLGNAFGPLLGNGTGHYRLDLSNKNDRLALRKLAELNNLEKEVAQQMELDTPSLGGEDESGSGSKFSKKYLNALDTSQKGNWSNFRNEQFNNAAIELNHEWFKDIPRSGSLEFDYVSTSRPGKGATQLSDARFVQIAARLRLSELDYSRKHYRGRHTPVTAIESDFFHVRYSGSQSQSQASNDESDGESIVSDCESESSMLSEDNDDAHDGFDHSNGARIDAVNSRGEHRIPPCVHTKDAVHHWQYMAATRKLKYNWFGRRFLLTHDVQDPAHIHDNLAYNTEETNVANTEQVQDDEKHKYEGEDPEEEGKAVEATPSSDSKKHKNKDKKKHHKGKKHTASSAESEPEAPPAEHNAEEGPAQTAAAAAVPGVIGSSADPNNMLHITHDDWHHKHHLSDHPPASYKFVYYKLLELHSTTTSLYFSATQAAKIVKMFPADDFCRVEAALILFSRIFNVERFHEILDELSPMERDEVFHRVGVMNCMSSYYPERALRDLDLRAYDNRQIAKVFVKLAIDEPGENMVNVAFRWSPEDPFIPGYSIPLCWQYDDGEDPEKPGMAGIRQVGNLSIEYRTDYEDGCRPDWPLRRALANRFMHGRAGTS